MSHSASVHLGLTCDFCNRDYQWDGWILIDTQERPDLLEQACAGTLHDAVCPGCGHPNRINLDLLLYRPQDRPVLLFSPSEGADLRDAKDGLRQLLGMLKRALGPDWRQEWLSPSVLGVRRHELARVLRQGESAIPAQPVPDAELLQLIPELLGADQWEGTQKMLEANPRLLDDATLAIFDDMVERTGAHGHVEGHELFAEYRSLLQRCREIGVQEAIREKSR